MQVYIYQFINIYCHYSLISKNVLLMYASGINIYLRQLFLFCRFYLPHGLSVDTDGNYWVTDVALHQVIFRLAVTEIEVNEVILSKSSGIIGVFSCDPVSL